MCSGTRQSSHVYKNYLLKHLLRQETAALIERSRNGHAAGGAQVTALQLDLPDEGSNGAICIAVERRAAHIFGAMQGSVIWLHDDDDY